MFSLSAERRTSCWTPDAQSCPSPDAQSCLPVLDQPGHVYARTTGHRLDRTGQEDRGSHGHQFTVPCAGKQLHPSSNWTASKRFHAGVDVSLQPSCTSSFGEFRRQMASIIYYPSVGKITVIFAVGKRETFFWHFATEQSKLLLVCTLQFAFQMVTWRR